MTKAWIIDLFRKQLMKCGNLATADRILRDVFLQLKKDHFNPWTVVFLAIQATRPLLHLKTIRVAKSSLSIPVPLAEKQQPSLAIRWLVQEARLRTEQRTMSAKLVAELSDAAFSHHGAAVQRKIHLHQLAEKNLANLRSK